MRIREWPNARPADVIIRVPQVDVKHFQKTCCAMRAVTVNSSAPRRSFDQIPKKRALDPPYRVTNTGYFPISPVSTRANKRPWISSIRR